MSLLVILASDIGVLVCAQVPGSAGGLCVWCTAQLCADNRDPALQNQTTHRR